METKSIICLIIFAITMIVYVTNKIPMWVAAVLACCACFVTGCASASNALSGFANTNLMLIAAMFILAAGLDRTSYIDSLCDWILRVTGGSFKKAYFGYLIVAIILINFTNSAMVAYAVIAPLLGALCDKSGESRSKYMFPLLVTILATLSVLPLAGAVANAAMFNGMLEAVNFTAWTVKPLDFFLGRIPILIIVPLWAYFIGPKVTPSAPVAELSFTSTKREDKKPLPKFQNTAGLVIFSVTILCVIFADQIGVAAWAVSVIGAMLMVVFGVLKGKEATKSIPLDLIIMVAGNLGLASALTNTGAGEIIGNWVAGFVGGTKNSFVASFLFFVAPFILTQFLNNRAVTQVFGNIAILACASMNVNPVGPLILTYAGATTAYFTPMGTPAAAMVMGDGGYDIKSMFKSGWSIALIFVVVYTVYMSLVFPIF